MADSWIVVGTVTSVNPAKRTIRVDAEPQHAHQFEELTRARLRMADGHVRTARVAAVRETEQGILLTLAAGVTRDTVATMRNADVVIAPDEVKARPEGVYVAEDFPGMGVVDATGAAVGTVSDAFATPASFVIEIVTVHGGQLLVPVVDEVVLAIDLAARRITVGDVTGFAVRGDAADED